MSSCAANDGKRRIKGTPTGFYHKETFNSIAGLRTWCCRWRTVGEISSYALNSWVSERFANRQGGLTARTRISG